MKTIKVIDLLNKIANGEEIPIKIKFREILFKYDDSFDIYCEYINDKDENLWSFISLDSKDINEELEIIEEEKEIEKLKNTINYYIDYEDERLNEDISHICRHLISHIDKINELIDAVNELNKKK